LTWRKRGLSWLMVLPKHPTRKGFPDGCDYPDSERVGKANGGRIGRFVG
jgi:hypothetical protein